jgi:hypothetical protein
MITEKFTQLYQELNKDNLELLGDLYSEEITFIDPLNRIEGLDDLTNYFADLYENVSSISFDFIEIKSFENSHFVTWNMTLAHTKLNRGKSYIVPGVTHLQTDENEKINYHRDYFDAGKMLYEQIPVIGTIITWIKRKL